MTPEKTDYDQLKLSDNETTLNWVVGDEEIRITAYQGPTTFLSLDFQRNEYYSVGSGETLAIRQYLN